MLDAMDETAFLQAMKASAAQSMRRHVELGWINSGVRPDVSLRNRNCKSPRRLELLTVLSEQNGWINCPDVAAMIGANLSDTAARLRRLLALDLVERQGIADPTAFGKPRFKYRITDKGRSVMENGGLL